MLRGRSAYECGQPPEILMQCTCPVSHKFTHKCFSGLVMQVEIACLEVGQYECGQLGGEGHVGRLISQANIRFAYLDSQRKGRVIQEILWQHASPQEILSFICEK